MTRFQTSFVEARVHVSGGRILPNVETTVSILITVAIVVSLSKWPTQSVRFGWCPQTKLVANGSAVLHAIGIFPSAAIEKLEPEALKGSSMLFKV